MRRLSLTQMAKQPSYIALTCTCCHVLALYCIFIGLSFGSPPLPLREKLAIRTFSLPTAVQERPAAVQELPKNILNNEATVEKAAQAPVAEIKKVKKEPTKAQPDAARSKKVSSPPKALPPKSIEKPADGQVVKKQALLQKAQSALQKVQKMPLKPITTGHQDSLQEPFNIDLPLNLSEIAHHLDVTYEQELATILQLLLTLPEHEEMDIVLTLNRAGLVIGLDFKQSNSQQNRKYVQETISQVHFPPFGQEFPGEKEHTFSIKLNVSNT